MSDFAGEGFKPFPNTEADLHAMHTVAEWDEDVVEHKITEYWLFLERTDIMPRARNAAKRILEHLGFEIDFRQGCYIEQEMESLDGTIEA